MSISMIHRLVQSAFQTGYLSVESEGLLGQMVTIRGCQTADLSLLEELHEAIRCGKVKREAGGSLGFWMMLKR